MRLTHTLPAVLLLASAIAGCDTQHESDSTPKSDVQFIDAMVPHHRMAVHMADMVLARGDSADIKEMAQVMKDAQTAEITKMESIRMQLAGSAEVPDHEDEHAEADMQKMMDASGTALDRLFLEEMLPHHAGAITMAHEAMPYLEQSELKVMASQIIADQAKEIGQIGEMLSP